MIKIGEKIQRFYPPWLELIPPFLLAFVLAYTVYNYALLPEMMPTHFGLSGRADDWSHKDFWSVYLSLIIGAVVWFSVLMINYFLIMKPDDPGKYINLSPQQKVKLGPVQLEYIRTITARGMFIINLTMAAMIATLQYGSINTALGIQKGLGWSVAVFGLALFVESIWLTVKTVSATFTPKTKR